MTDSFVTQCPHCQTSFRVTHHQLSVARGVVRCGACLQVFNAARQLLEQSTGNAAPATPAIQPVPTPSAPEPAIEHPPVSQEEWAVTEQELDDLDLDQALAHLERREDIVERQAEPRDEQLHARRDEPDADDHHDDHEPFGTATEEHAEPGEPLEPSPPLIEQEALDLDTEPDERTEPSLTTLDLDLDDDSEPPVRPAKRTMDEPRPPVANGLNERLSAHDDDDLIDAPEERLEPGLAASASRPSRKEPLIDLVDDPLQLGWQKPRPNWRRRLLWGALVLVAAGLLAVQYIWYHFDEMARQDQFRPWFQQFCPTLGCTVPSRVDIDRIRSSNLVVRSHPDFKGALIVDAIIYNRAPFAQPFPLLELRFADLNGQLIASRRFKPSEYLSGELAGRGEMPSQTPIHIALDILDPGPKAVNYSLSFRSPE
ncbi:DUF3426 domain-containing protein [Pseudomonas sp. X10]